MKKLMARIWTPLSLSVLLLAGAAQAQYAPRVAKIKVPFEFSAGNNTYPAGEYSVVKVAPNRIDLRDADFRMLTSFLTVPVEAQKPSVRPKMVFSTADGDHVLTRIWFESDSTGQELWHRKNGALAKRRSQEPVQTAAGSK